MKKTKNIFLSLIFLFVLSLTGCTDSESEIEKSTSNIVEDNEDTYESDYSDYSYSSSSSSSKTSVIEHYCEVSDCYDEGTYEIEGFSGLPEYYCYTHYQEMQDIISYMEETVGSGSASKHSCESCSKEGTHAIEGIYGRTEYYCTEHYNEMIEILEMLLGE